MTKKTMLWKYKKSSLSGVPDYFGRNEISSGGDLSDYSSASLYYSFILFCLICVY